MKSVNDNVPPKYYLVQVRLYVGMRKIGDRRQCRLNLPKCPPAVAPKLMSCAMVQEGARVCLGKSISHLYHSL
jgi:hypothetical protein